jgi:hypothetical protein
MAAEYDRARGSIDWPERCNWLGCLGSEALGGGWASEEQENK